MQTKKAKEGYLLVSRKEGSLSVTDRVSAPDGTDLTDWEELPEAEELAILRQRDTKAEEFEAYNAYAESCKEEARLLIEKQKH